MKSIQMVANELWSTKADAINHILDFERPKGLWRIQRPDGCYFMLAPNGRDRAWTRNADHALPFSTQTAAQHWIDIEQGSQAGRTALRDCTVVEMHGA